MELSEPLGYLASLLVLATFCMRGMVSLRLVAIASNLAFIGYASMVGITPVLLLHALLLPVNVLRLSQALLERRCAGRPDQARSDASVSGTRPAISTASRSTPRSPT